MRKLQLSNIIGTRFVVSPKLAETFSRFIHRTLLSEKPDTDLQGTLYGDVQRAHDTPIPLVLFVSGFSVYGRFFMSEKTFFWHNASARLDQRAVNMRSLLGYGAYAVYWEIVSLIYQNGGKCKLSDIMYNSDICQTFGVGSSHVQCIILVFGLFEHDATHVWFKKDEPMHHAA